MCWDNSCTKEQEHRQGSGEGDLQTHDPAQSLLKAGLFGVPGVPGVQEKKDGKRKLLLSPDVLLPLHSFFLADAVSLEGLLTVQYQGH